MSKTNGTVVLDLGKRSRKRVKALKRGKGSLVGEIEAKIRQSAELAGGADVLPVVILFEKKKKKKKRAKPSLMNPLGL